MIVQRHNKIELLLRTAHRYLQVCASHSLADLCILILLSIGFSFLLLQNPNSQLIVKQSCYEIVKQAVFKA